MKKWLFTLALLVSLGAPAVAEPVVTLGPPVTDEFFSYTINPSFIRVEMLDAANFVDLQVSIRVLPQCFIPFDFDLGTTGDGGTFTNQSGVVHNNCGGDTSIFNIRLTGDGLVHMFDIEFIDIRSGTTQGSIPVELVFPGADDTDGDGISDLIDNCTEIANVDQFDSNSDNIGNRCDADIAPSLNDCRIDFHDLAAMRAAIFSTPDSANWNADADLNGDGDINFADLQTVKASFFTQPGPSGLPNACALPGEGDICDPGASLCGTGLSCCYPCGIPGCDNVCEVTCAPSDPGCIDGCFIRP